MPKQTHTFEYTIYETLEELSPSFQSLMQEAVLARAMHTLLIQILM
jgi:hypothetical protein